MIQFIEKLFFQINTRFNIHNLNYLPRWVIVVIDFSVLVIAFIFSSFLFKEIGFTYIKTDNKIFFITSFFLINLFSFWLFKTYSGIIRHSSFIDAIKLFISQAFVLLVFFVINAINAVTYGQKIFVNTFFFINLLISFFGLFIYRVIIKQIFDIYFTEKELNTKLVRTIIYGADANAISIANALKSETPTRFWILGFIDKSNKNSAKRILNLPIYGVKKRVPTLMRSLKAEGIIIADRGLTNDERLKIVDQCLEFNYKVFTVPIISDWENQKEISQKVKNIQIEDLLERPPIVLDNKAINKELKDKVVLISGAAGSIGSEIVRQVLSFRPQRLLILDQAETPLYQISLDIKLTKESDSKTEIYTILADIRDIETLEKTFETHRPNVVFHAAAYKHVPLMEENPAEAVFTNILGTKNLADLSCKYNVTKFIMISTDKAVNPSNVMGASKRIAEKYVQSLRLQNKKQDKLTTKFIATRFGNVLGSNGSVVPLFTQQIAAGGPITITHPDIIRYFMTIPEACQLVLEAGAMGNGGEIYIFDMGKPVKIIDLAKKMIKLAGYIPDKEIKIEVIGLRPGEKLYEELLNDTSKTLPTHHDKIMIAQDLQGEYEILHKQVKDLIKTSETSSNKEIVAKMKEIIPEFVSMNSEFQVLDK